MTAGAQLGLKIEDMEAMLAEAHEASVDGLQRTYIACSTLADGANAGMLVAAAIVVVVARLVALADGRLPVSGVWGVWLGSVGSCCA